MTTTKGTKIQQSVHWLLGAVLAFISTCTCAQQIVNSVSAPVLAGTDLYLKIFATIPANSDGKTAQINSMTTVDGRLFVVETGEGKIWEITGGSTQLWFDLENGLQAATGAGLDHSSSFHGGLRSLAFHPDFNVNGKFYTSQMLARPANPGNHHYLSDTVSPIDADSVLVEWTADQNGIVDNQSFREIFRVGMSVYDHPIKQIAFNPFSIPSDEDFGLLYITHGDGSIASETVGGGQNNDALGKVMRIDPLATANASYSIPASNPFVNDPSMLDEVYSIGHRNPHNLAFSRSGKLIVVDAGRDNAEEVNLVEAGSDHGWLQREGTFVHLEVGGLISGIAPLPADDANNNFTYPAAQFGHVGVVGQRSTRHAIAGGYVAADGSAFQGQYLYGEFTEQGDIFHSSVYAMNTAVTRGPPAALTQAPTHRSQIFFDHDNNPSTPALAKTSMLDVVDDSPEYDGSGRVDLRFGQGPSREIYITSKRNNTIYIAVNTFPSAQACFTDAQRTAPDQAYLIHNDGTATDVRSQLMWSVCAVGQVWSSDGCTATEKTMAWDDALATVDTANQAIHLGYANWRLPNKNELASLLELSCANPAINQNIFMNTPNTAFWTSTPSISENKSWRVLFSHGNVTEGARNEALAIRLVRSVQ